MRKNNFGFTLAEVLITLSIIGVVAAITLPMLVANINERINSERQANVAQKVTRAMEQMKAQGLLNTQYQTTEAFVDELQKYLKVSKRCNANNIAECWPTTSIKTGEAKEYKILRAKTGKDIHLETTTNNVGLILADGSSIILNYNPEAKGLDVADRVEAYNMSLPVGNNKNKDFVYSSNVTNAIDFLIDTNGKRGPNSETVDNKFHDIRSFKGASFGGCSGIKVPEIGCIVELGNNFECISEPPFNNNNNCWAGIRNACEKIGMSLPNKDTLDTIFSIKSNYPYLAYRLAWYYSSDESADKYNAYRVAFSNGTGVYAQKGYSKDVFVMCVAD